MPGAHKRNRPPSASKRSKEASAAFAAALVSGDQAAIEKATNGLIAAFTDSVQRLVSGASRYAAMQQEKDGMRISAIDRKFAELLERQQGQIGQLAAVLDAQARVLEPLEQRLTVLEGQRSRAVGD